MSVEISDIRNGLATNLRTIADNNQVRPYRTTPSPPSLVVVGFDQIVRTGFSNHSFEIPFIIQGLAGKATDESAYRRLDEWLSPTGAKNVWTAIESDPTLGGKVSSLAVTSCDGAQFITLDNGQEYLGSTWHVQIEL